MVNIILWDQAIHDQLLPITYLQPLGQIRLGRWRFADKWRIMTGGKVSHKSSYLLSDRFPCNVEDKNVIIPAYVLPSFELSECVMELEVGQYLEYQGRLIAVKLNSNETSKLLSGGEWKSFQRVEFTGKVQFLENPEDFLQHSESQILLDYRLSDDLTSEVKGEHVRVIGDQLKVGEGVTAVDCTLNTMSGPIILGKGSVIMEGCQLRGPLVLGEGSVVKMGASIYGATSVGRECKVGGEIKNSIFGDFSNKGHEGYIGDSVIGEWCNLGAGTSCSNMKNTYGEVKIWSIISEERRGTARQFCGMFMGDHTKTAINTSFSTGSVTGIFCNILEPRPPSFVPSFSWGPGSRYDLDKLLEVTRRSYERKEVQMGDDEEQLIRSLHMQHT